MLARDKGGGRYKTFNNCRRKAIEQAETRPNPKVKCLSGEELLWDSLDRHEYSWKHLDWRENNTFICECGRRALIRDKDKDGHCNSFHHKVMVGQ